MRVIVINPWDRNVSEDEHHGDFRDYYRLLSGPTLERLEHATVRCFDIIEVGDADGHVLFVDDEGLFAEPQAYFQLSGGNTFAGRGVLARRNEEGENENATLTVD